MPSFYEVPPELLAALRALPSRLGSLVYVGGFDKSFFSVEGEGVRAPPKHNDNDENDKSGGNPPKRGRIEPGASKQ